VSSEEGRRRAYRSPLRARQADATREMIRHAAERLFLQRGYPSVSVDAIAEAAGVGRQTIFAAFGSKSGLLQDLIKARIAGEGASIVADQRDSFERMYDEPDPRDVLRISAEMVAKISARTASLYEVLVAAAPTDPEVAALRERIDQQWLDGMGQVVDLLAARNALPADHDRNRAREQMWLLTGAGPYLMARSRGWSSDEYVAWLTRCSIAVLLDDGAAPIDTRPE
jgi:AcrR family transcriptional regulator